MSTFWLKIVASDHIFYNGNHETLVVPAHDGEFDILPHHEAMILATQGGELWFRIPGEGQWGEAVVGCGIVQAVDNRVIMIVGTAERPEGIDAVKAKEALERAEEQMHQKQNLRELRMPQASMARILARLKRSHLEGL